MATLPSLNDSEKASRIFREAKRAYEDAVSVTQTNTKNIVVLNFKALQLLRIKSLQQELFDFQMRIQLGGFTPEEYGEKLNALDFTLQKYAQALKDYDTLAQNSLDYVPDSQELFGAPDGLYPRDTPESSHRFWFKGQPNQCTEFNLSNWRKYTYL